MSHFTINSFPWFSWPQSIRLSLVEREGRDLSSQARSAVLNINTVFKLRREALFPLVYFNFNFCVRNSTWNADTVERGARENAHGT